MSDLTAETETLPPVPQSTLALQFRRFRANRLAMASVTLLFVIVAACFFGPFFFPFTGEDANFDAIDGIATIEKILQ